jgi:hypothetical protein
MKRVFMALSARDLMIPSGLACLSSASKRDYCQGDGQIWLPGDQPNEVWSQNTRSATAAHKLACLWISLCYIHANGAKPGIYTAD